MAQSVVDTEIDYQAWLDEQKTVAQLSAPVTKGEGTIRSRLEQSGTSGGRD